MRSTRPAAIALTALLLSSCTTSATARPAGDGEAVPRSSEVAPNVYEVAPGQGREAAAADTVGVLEVSGTGRVRVAPDRTRITFAVETEDSTASGASVENARRMGRVHEALQELDAPDLTLETFGYDLQPRYGRPEPGQGGSRRIEGYRATNLVRVTVDEVEGVGRILDAAIAAGANRTTGLAFEATDTEEARREALRLAVDDARSKAEAIAGALGVELGPPLEVTGGADSPPPPRPFRVEAMAQATPETPVEAGEQTLSASVTIRYRLAPGPR